MPDWHLFGQIRPQLGGSVSYVFGVSRDVVCRLAVVGALRQPPLDRVAVGGGVILAAALETGTRSSHIEKQT